MSNLEIAVSADSLNRIYLVLLYASLGGFACRWLVPRLSFEARILALALLAAQIVVVFISQTIETSSFFVERLWELQHEWNVPSALAFTQLATVGALSILLAWIGRGKPAWHRLYLAALGLIFIFLSIDEYFRVHEKIELWYVKYAAAGIAVALITVIAALRSSARERKWFACLLGGLAIGALGAILFERVNRACGGLLFLRFPDCFHFYVWEESAELLGIWLALVAILGIYSELKPRPSRKAGRFILSLPPIALLFLLSNAILPSIELPLLARKASIEFENEIRLRGYNIDYRAANDGWVSVRLYFSAKQKDYFWVGYSIHLVDQVNGKSVASGDSWVERQHSIWPLGEDFEQVYRQMIDVPIPPDTPRNRAYWIIFTLWRPSGEGFASQIVRFSDHHLLSDTQVALGEIALQEIPAASTEAALATFDEGFALLEADLPDRTYAGEELSVRFTWRAKSQGDADYIQFLHLAREDNGDWFGYDRHPLGARLPTRLWYGGLADSETWQAPLPADLKPGRYMVFTGLYDARDQSRLSARGADGSLFPEARVPLGSLTVINEG